MGLAERISLIQRYDEYFELKQSLSGTNSRPSFEEIWTIALKERWDGSKAVASFLLASLDVAAPRTLEDLLLDIAGSSFDLSNRVLPFYLVTQFGKLNVLAAVEKLIRATTDQSQKVKLDTVAYWARMPAEDLIHPLHYFEWTEIIEGRGSQSQ